MPQVVYDVGPYVPGGGENGSSGWLGSGDQPYQGSSGSSQGDYNSNGGAFSTAGSASGNASSSTGNALNYAQTVSDAINQFNLDQTEMVNEFNAKEAQKNRDWQEYMAKNAHQFEVEDLIKAGLNPVLSVGGQGAYVGSGAVAQGQKAVADNTMSKVALEMLSNSFNSAGAVASGAAQSGKFSMSDLSRIWTAIIGGAAHLIGKIF